MLKIAPGSLTALAAVALLAGGCGSSASSSSTPRTTIQAAIGTAQGNTVHVVMQSLDFTPTAVEAKVGQTILWTNEDSAPHNVRYLSGPAFRSSGLLAPGAKFSIRLAQPGTIHYFCSLHPWMKATIDVSP